MKHIFICLLLTTSCLTSNCVKAQRKAPIFLTLNVLANKNNQLNEITQTRIADQAAHTPASWWQTIKAHKSALLKWLAVTCWFSTQACISFLERAIARSHWLDWKSEKPMQELLLVNRNLLLQELRNEIREHIGIGASAVLLFFQHIEHEEQLLKLHTRIIKIVSKLWLSKIFWFSKTLFEHADQKTNRLAFLKSLIAQAL